MIELIKKKKKFCIFVRKHIKHIITFTLNLCQIIHNIVFIISSGISFFVWSCWAIKKESILSSINIIIVNIFCSIWILNLFLHIRHWHISSCKKCKKSLLSWFIPKSLIICSNLKFHPPLKNSNLGGLFDVIKSISYFIKILCGKFKLRGLIFIFFIP